MNDYNTDDIPFAGDTINRLAQKILDWHTPEKLFERKLNHIYAT